MIPSTPLASRIAARLGCAAYAATVCSGEVAEVVVTFADGQQRRVVACAACRAWFARSFRVTEAPFVPEWRRRLTAVDRTGAVRAA